MPRSFAPLVLAACAALGLASAAARAELVLSPVGDRLVLKDGRTLEGELVAETADGVTFRSGGTARFYGSDQIERKERGAAPQAPSAAGTQPEAGGAADTGSAPAPTPAPEKSARPGKEEFGKRPKVLTDASRAWVAELAAKASSTEDDQVRRGIAAALEALGPAAIPAIRDAAANANPGGQSFLTRVADRLAEKLPRKGEGLGADGTGGGAAPEKGEDGMTAGATPAPGGDVGRKGVGEKGAGERGKGRALFEKLAADLELRDDQRPAFGTILMKLDRARGQLSREVEGGLPLADAATRLETAKTDVLTAARGVLDAGQMEMFTELSARHFDDLAARLAKIATKAPRPADAPAPAPQGAGTGGEERKQAE